MLGFGNPFGRTSRFGHTGRAPKVRRFENRCRPELEWLEQRDVPTVIFDPQFGAETIFWKPTGQAITNPMPLGSNPTVLKSPFVYLIFSGNTWTSETMDLYSNKAREIIQSDYLTGLTDYGSDGFAFYGGSAYDPTERTASWQNTDAAINSILPKQPTWYKPTDNSEVDSPIYVVVFDNGGGDGNNGGQGQYTPPNSSTALVTNHIRINGPAGLDDFTYLFSHELVERIASGSDGIGMNAPSNVSGEYQNAQIADNEPDGGRYMYRLYGAVDVQAYWSIKYQAFIVPDGSQQDLHVTPIWSNGSYTGKAVWQDQGNLHGIVNGLQTLVARNVKAYSADGYNFSYLTNNGTWTQSGSLQR